MHIDSAFLDIRAWPSLLPTCQPFTSGVCGLPYANRLSILWCRAARSVMRILIALCRESVGEPKVSPARLG